MNNNYYKTFWHLITEGSHRENDKIDSARAEKIPWIFPIIDQQPDKDCLVWEKKCKRNNSRTLIYYPKYRYLIVLEKRIIPNLQKHEITFWTAYPTNYEHTHKKLIKEYKAHK